jgi:hypothetical protein
MNHKGTNSFRRKIVTLARPKQIGATPSPLPRNDTGD